MAVLDLILYLLAGVFFGLAAGRVPTRLDFIALGLLMWVLVPFFQAIQKL